MIRFLHTADWQIGTQFGQFEPDEAAHLAEARFETVRRIAEEAAARKVSDVGMRAVVVFVKGPGGGRESAVRALQAAGLSVISIKDVTPIPHNGCRPPKRRRV